MEASQLIQGGEQCFIANIVLCEMVWVLQGNPFISSERSLADLTVPKRLLLTANSKEKKDSTAYNRPLA
jgi:predicted nucleic-acid-binding protein